MGGCSVVLMVFVFLPLLLIGLAIFLGLIGAAIVGLVISLITLLVLWRTGVFKKYMNSNIWWQKFLSITALVILLVVFIVSLVAFGIGLFLIVK